jgi:hypothetical protein
MQQYNHSQSHIQIKFFILTEHISFLPTPIINACQLLNIGRALKEDYVKMTNNNIKKTTPENETRDYIARISEYKPKLPYFKNDYPEIKMLFNKIDLEGIMNIKDTRYFEYIKEPKDFPKEVFNIVCDNIIQEIESNKKLNFTDFRDTLYDILTYNLDATECLSYILQYFIESGKLDQKDTSDVLIKMYVFLKYYNNNYRPIYHLESIMFYIINKIRKYNEL